MPDTPLDELLRRAGGGIATPSSTPVGSPLDDLLQRTGQTPSTEPQGIFGTALSYAAPVLDFISRPQYASAKFFDSTINDSVPFFDALGQAVDELVAPSNRLKRLSFEDVIRRADPEFATREPGATIILGFLGDIALDPSSYL